MRAHAAAAEGARPAAGEGRASGECVARVRVGAAARTARAATLLLLLLGALLGTAAAAAMGEDCDWRGSGLSGPERGVSPVYLRCAQGRLDWAYPRGALRVLLRLGSSGADFRGCVRLGGGAGGGGARLFLEGPRSLAPLFDAGDGAPARLARCFRSRGGVAALYVEALPPAAAAASAAVAAPRPLSFTYDLEALPRGAAAYDPQEQCRPCTKEEMSRAFCTSDLVARGIIRGVQNRPELEVTELNVKVTKMLRRPVEGPCSENDVSADGAACGGGGDGEAAAPAHLALQVPLHCGARHGAGEFVVMARRRLGDLALTCAPRLQDWVAAARQLQAAGAAHCVLAS